MYTDDPTYRHCKNNTWNPESSELLFDDSTDLPISLLLNDSNVEFLINQVSILCKQEAVRDLFMYIFLTGIASKEYCL